MKFNGILRSAKSAALTSAPVADSPSVTRSLTPSVAGHRHHSQLPAHSGDLALGLDPDFHFFNDGINFTMTLTPVPEMAALYPIMSLLAAIACTHFLRRRRSAQLQMIEISER